MKLKITFPLLLLTMLPAFSFGQSATKPLTRTEILGRLAVEYSPSYVARLAVSRGIGFSPSESFLSAVKAAGGEGILVERLSSPDAAGPRHSFSDTDGSTEYLAKCAELLRAGDAESAEKECRAAIDENPESPWPLLATLRVLDQLGVSSEERNALPRRGAALELEIAAVQSEQVDEVQGYLFTSQSEADYRNQPELEAFSPEIERQVNSEVEDILQDSPDLARSHLRAAHSLQNLGNFERAHGELKEALRLEPGNAGIHYALGYFYRSQRNAEEEIAQFRTAVRLAPYGTLERDSLTESLVRLGRPDEAIGEWRNLLALAPQNLRACNALVQLYLRQNDRKSAIAELRRSLKASSDASKEEASYANERFQDIVYLAQLLTENRDYDGAAGLYALLLRFNPDAASLHNSYGNVLFAERHFANAIAEYRAALQFQTDLPAVHRNLATCLAAQKDLDAAISEFRLALETDPDEPNTRILLGVALGQRGDLNGAMDQFQQVIANDPGDPLAHTQLAHTYFLNNDSSSAIAELKLALELRPDFLPAENELARIYAISPDPHYRNPGAALSLARHASQSSKEPSPAFLDTLAEALLLNGQPVEALKTEEQAAKLAPDDQDIQTRFARMQQAATTASSSLP
jgi:tetratricopeptide (TPR) repeat protein